MIGLPEVLLPQDLFRQILQRIWRLEPIPDIGWPCARKPSGRDRPLARGKFHAETAALAGIASHTKDVRQ